MPAQNVHQVQAAVKCIFIMNTRHKCFNIRAALILNDDCVTVVVKNTFYRLEKTPIVSEIPIKSSENLQKFNAPPGGLTLG